MEWVHGNGRSVEEAKERALEELGVAESDAEIEVLTEPKTGLFGRVRGEALVKARVRPVELRPKRQRRQRDRSAGAEGASGANRTGPSRAAGPDGGGGAERAGGSEGAGRPAGGAGSSGRSSSARRRRGRQGGPQVRPDSPASDGADDETGNGRRGADAFVAGAAREESTMADGVTLEDQAQVAKEFLEGLLDRYGLDATVEIRELDEETVELATTGEGLGVLVGPKGATIAALQDVVRTVVQRHFPNRTDRILVDVAGYRERRIAALRRFSEQVGAEVRSSGVEQALEPMSAADRKVVHDTVADLEGLVSRSQGDDPYRFVVIAPEG